MSECRRIDIAPTVCYLRFGPWDSHRETAVIGRTVRGEMMIADMDAEGRVIGIELVGTRSRVRRRTGERRRRESRYPDQFWRIPVRVEADWFSA